jgi:hypothetical protein
MIDLPSSTKPARRLSFVPESFVGQMVAVGRFVVGADEEADVDEQARRQPCPKSLLEDARFLGLRW